MNSSPAVSVAPIRVALLGVGGRMGRALLVGVDEAPDLTLSGALVSPSSRWLNQDTQLFGGATGVIATAHPTTALQNAQVAIDFTLPSVTASIVAAAIATHCPLVIGTTGHSAEQHATIENAARHIPIVMAANMSLGVNLMLKLAELAAKALDDEYDIEIFEAHHRNKKDAPSGTALAIGEVVAKARGVSLKTDGDFVRHGETGARRRGAIGFSVLRGGDIIGEHTLTFAGPGERIELTHRAHDRAGFARGALLAARWLVHRKPGLYSMQDVIFP
ncbi:MAG: 4-hydroxy-tetrahydrodipicolinate reductase [Candidatus Obscuribacterales bacterium]|nr:4-hydroxy-tetrahydrodipicolinate reductase [Steroidobacteraceae bacterium]